MWFGIIIFGVANGFILLPVMLSLCGPLNRVKTNAVTNSDNEAPSTQKKLDEVKPALVGTGSINFYD